jgi:hypothetical protein
MLLHCAAFYAQFTTVSSALAVLRTTHTLSYVLHLVLNSFFGLRVYITENRVGRIHDKRGVISDLNHRLTSTYLTKQQMVTIETDMTSLICDITVMAAVRLKFHKRIEKMYEIFNYGNNMLLRDCRIFYDIRGIGFRKIKICTGVRISP